ncbi:hypothetical protein BGX24_007103 [Mortierella sp. AD032]|nr:hypothetical protein BGX24_007103 [Mortierella sp. AD032]
MTAADGRVRSRSLMNRDRSTLQSTLGHELSSTDIRIAWQQVGEGFVEDDEDPVLAISRPCLTALPSIRDRFGFVEYGDESDDNEEVVQGQLHGVGSMDARCTGTDDEWALVDSIRPILDVNDTSAMIAAGIDPSEEHLDSKAFCYIHHAAEDRMGIHCESLEAVTATEKVTFNQNHSSESEHHCPESETATVDPTFKQRIRSSILFKTSQPIVKCLRQTRKSRVVKKWISRPLKNVFSSGRDETPQFTATEIRRTGLGMDRVHSDTRGSMCSDGWLHRLPGGPASVGKFDRDWLDAGAEVR